MKYKRHVATGVLAFSLLAGGVSAFAADMTASTTKVNQYTNQVKMKSPSKQDKFDSSDTDTSTKKANRNKNKVKSNSVKNKVDAKNDMVKNVSTKHTKVNKIHKSTINQKQSIKNQVGSI